LRPAADVQKGMDMAKKLAEENKAIGVNLGEDTLIKTDTKSQYFKVKIPDFICKAVCAGLNMDEIASGSGTIEEPEDFNMTDSNLFRTEEGYHIDMGRKGKDKRLDSSPSTSVSTFKQ